MAAAPASPLSAKLCQSRTFSWSIGVKRKGTAQTMGRLSRARRPVPAELPFEGILPGTVAMMLSAFRARSRQEEKLSSKNWEAEVTSSNKLSLLKTGLLGTTFALGLIGSANAADLIFLKVPGVTGPSTDKNHPGEIPLLAFDPLASSTTPGAVKPCGQFTAVKQTDQTSPVFLGDLYKGFHIASAIITFAANGVDYYKISLTNVLVVSIVGAMSPSINLENMTLSAQSFTVSFTPSAGPAITFGWDCTRNMQI